MTTRTVTAEAEAQTRQPWFRRVAHFGMATRGVIYLVIAIVAIQVAMGEGGETADQRGALEAVAEQPLGRGLLVVLAVGLAAYALWRLAQGFLDTDDKGDDASGWAVRASKVGSAVVHGGLCVSALTLLGGAGGGGSGGTTDPQRTTGGVLGWPAGRVWVIAVALVIAGVAAWNLYRGVSRAFMKRLHPPAEMRRVVETVGLVGMCARAVVFGLVAAFLLKAAVEYDPTEAVGLDGALARLSAEPYGGFLLGGCALGLFAFALYCFAEARYREV